MVLMSDDDFYVEDESPEELRTAWKRGQDGVTRGPRDLNQRAKAIVDRAVELMESETIVIDTTGWFGPVDPDAAPAKPSEGADEATTVRSPVRA
jgi:hypothetical protein